MDVIIIFTSRVQLKNKRQEPAAQHYAELDLFGVAVGHPTHLCFGRVVAAE